MKHRSLATSLVALSIAFIPVFPCAAQGLGGFNLFSTSQDVEIGKQSALEAEKQLPILNDVRTTRYLNGIVARLAAVAPGAKFPYQVKLVNSADINAFALPGGPMYVNTGLIAAARSEAELAGVLAHEISHVALRHGTQHASSAYIGQAGLGVLGGLFGRNKNASQVVGAVGGLGLNALFLKYSRDDELKADESGARIMAQAGYDPMAMATLLEMLQTEQGREPSKLEQFFSDHPAAGDREARIRTLAPTLAGTRKTPVGNFAGVQRRLGNLATTTAQAVGRLDPPATTPTVTTPAMTVTVVTPSTRVVRYTHPTSGFVTIDRPENWPAFSAPNGYTISIAPEQGVVQTPDGIQHMVYGLIVSHYEPFASLASSSTSRLRSSYVPIEDRTPENASLLDATNDLVATIVASNPTLAMVDGSTRSERISGAPALSLLLSGTSQVTGEGEQVTVFTRRLSDGHVVYALAIAPTRVADQLNPAFVRMMQSLVVNAGAAHKSTTRAVAPAPGALFKRP
jgi:Zn-dependent protease with chaperone function